MHQGEDRCALPVEALSLSLSSSSSESLVAEVMAEVRVPAVEMLVMWAGCQPTRTYCSTSCSLWATC